MTKSTLLLLGYLLHKVVSDLLSANINKFPPYQPVLLSSWCTQLFSPFTCPPVQQSSRRRVLISISFFPSCVKSLWSFFPPVLTSFWLSVCPRVLLSFNHYSHLVLISSCSQVLLYSSSPFFVQFCDLLFSDPLVHITDHFLLYIIFY